MVIKALAIELYRAQQSVHKLQDQLDKATLAERELLRRELERAQAECDQLRRLVEARKDPPPFRRTY